MEHFVDYPSAWDALGLTQEIEGYGDAGLPLPWWYGDCEKLDEQLGRIVGLSRRRQDYKAGDLFWTPLKEDDPVTCDSWAPTWEGSFITEVLIPPDEPEEVSQLKVNDAGNPQLSWLIGKPELYIKVSFIRDQQIMWFQRERWKFPSGPSRYATRGMSAYKTALNGDPVGSGLDYRWKLVEAVQLIDDGWSFERRMKHHIQTKLWVLPMEDFWVVEK